MHTFVLQDRCTLKGTIATLLQAEERWLRVDDFRDAVVWWDVTEISGAVTVSVESSPTNDAALFTTLSSTTVGSPGRFAAICRAKGAAPPLTSWLRWNVTSTSISWTLSFRVLVSLNAAERGLALGAG